jgi:hypothetical protein
MSNIHCLTFDVETSGASLSRHKLIAIGLSVMKLDTETGNVSVVRGCEYGFPFDYPYDFEKRCATEFWDKDGKDALKYAVKLAGENTDDAAVTWRKIVNFIAEAHDEFPSIRIVTDNPGFDGSWVAHCLDRYLGELPLEYVRTRKTADGYLNNPDGTRAYRTLVGTNDVARGVMFGDNISEWAGKTWINPANAGVVGCPYDSDHTPLSDAKAIGWKYLRLISLLSGKQNASAIKAE